MYPHPCCVLQAAESDVVSVPERPHILVVSWQAAGSDVVSVLRALTAACQNDYNCKWLAKQGTVQAALKLLHSQSHASVFEVLCLLYAMTTEEEARLVVGQACANTDRDSATSAVAQLFAILLADNAGVHCLILKDTSCRCSCAALQALLASGC